MAGYEDGGTPVDREASADGNARRARRDPQADAAPADMGRPGGSPEMAGVQFGSGNLQVNHFNYYLAGPAEAGSGATPSMPASGKADSPDQGHAFVSYMREDSAGVDWLQQVLETAGIRVWRDRTSLWPGQDWRARIRDAITRDALVFIACFSSRSAARRTSYMNKELLLAIEQLQLRKPDDPWLIPVRFDDCVTPDLDMGAGRTLASIHRADLFGESRELEVGRLVTVVQRLLQRQAPGPPQPPFSHEPRSAARPPRPAEKASAARDRPNQSQDLSPAARFKKPAGRPLPDKQRPRSGATRRPLAAESGAAPGHPAGRLLGDEQPLISMADIDADVLHNADASWNGFSSHDYWRRNYRQLHAEDQEIIRRVSHFLIEVFAGRPRAQRGIDVGSGTNLYPALLMLPWTEQILLTDDSESNVAWLHDQLAEDTSEWTWRPFWREMREAKGYNEVDGPRQLLREACANEPGYAGIERRSVFDLPKARWDLGTMFFVAESITARPDEFGAAVACFARALKRGAPFAAAFMTGSAGYEVADAVYPAVPVSPDDVHGHFTELGASQLRVEALKTTNRVRDGYTGMIVATGLAYGR
jgi:hypothetical protein